ncbi:Chitin synthase 8 [Halotydeus destructor]|nr:Chitin synthase 8 [Halotydeus destructor]
MASATKGSRLEDFEQFSENIKDQDIYVSSGRSEAPKAWDVFQATPPADEDETLNSKWYELTLKFLKLCAYIITFSIVLTCAVLSKGSLLLMTSLIKPNRTGVSVCNQGIPGLDRDKRYEAIFNLNDPERTAWIWCIFAVLVIPELMTLFRSVRICTFKSYRRPTPGVFAMVFLMESLHTVGIALLVFVILPTLDVVKGAMLTNCLCFIPALLSLLSRHTDEKKRLVKSTMDFLSLAAQFSAFIIWPFTAQATSDVAYLIPVASLLISMGWWENYVNKSAPFAFVRGLASLKDNLHRCRYFLFIFISCWKIVVILVTMLLSRYMIDGSVGYLFTNFKAAFSQHKILIVRDRSDLSSLATHDHHVGIEGEWIELDSSSATPLTMLLLQVVASWLCYVVGKFACKIMIQGFSYAFPLSLTVPISISVLVASCGVYIEDSCSFTSMLPRYLFWTCPAEPYINESFLSFHSLMWILWVLSQTWITIHIWIPKCERLASTEKLFVNPMYCAAIIDQSLAMNRRRDDEADIKTDDINVDTDGLINLDASQHYETISESPDEKSIKNGHREDTITKVIACATMWHETTDEMVQMLKSVFRMDEDQCARRNAQKYLRIVDPDYFEFEVQIYFDDAFELCDENDEDMIVNQFVKKLVEVIDEAASSIHQCNIRLKPPKKYPTPYGGRLEWTMPGGNKLVSHLKDKIKIRHRKRWSQVMYMYYLLGHRLMELPIDVNRKAVMAENTYILTLDGDINFRPHAVQLLVDLMKKNRNLGAACGRIHPIGSGVMAWYQKFEYAIGHWLQKATEHMIGCVLCSPGCFSLFRAKALMDDNVMRKYTTRSEEALHYVQYDQGEDRWLCTLLLQRGYRVEYSAASDAYTHCPEGFTEFYTQRRRWAPSTMANIMDLLGDYKRTIAVNDHISFPYIIYQAMLMIGTILGPGTIFLMLVGALVAVFRISNWDSFVYNFVPILFFIIVCFVCKTEMQIFAAQLLSAAYAMLMMAVFVGTAIQMTEDGVSSPSAIFFIALTGSFFVAGILHPQEFSCVTPIFLYFLSIPCMYMLLMIYSLVNLNNVTWGTREVQTKKTKKEMEEEKKAAEEMKKKSLLSFLDMNRDGKDDEGSIVFSLANLFKCMFCTYPKSSEEKIHLIKIEDHLSNLADKMKVIERALDVPKRKGSSMGHRARFSDNLSTVTENEEMDDEMNGSIAGSEASDDAHSSVSHKKDRNGLVDPYWVEDKGLRNGQVCFLPEQEINFWNELIEKYLFPIDNDKQQQAKVGQELKELRNRMVFAFIMINALFILVVFLLQLNKDILHVDWPWGVRENITFIPETNEIRIDKTYLEMEPIGLVFVVFFGLILIIQIVGMLFHRFGTLSHILASVEMNCFNQKVEDISDDAFLDKNAINIVRQLQRLKGIDEDDRSDDSKYGNIVERRKTIQNLAKRQEQKHRIGTLDVAFRKRFMNISATGEGTPVLGGIRRRETINALERRRNTVLNSDRNSGQMQTLGVRNDFVRGNNRSTLDTKDTKNRRATILNNVENGMGGISNGAYMAHSSDEEHGDTANGQDMQMQNIYVAGSRHSLGRNRHP